MNGLEMAGAICIYIGIALIVSYSAAGIAGYFTRGRGLDAIPYIVLAFFGTAITSAAIGLILLGRMIS